MNEQWANDVWLKISNKMEAQRERVGTKIPYIAVDGHYTDRMDVNIYWWTNGFWPGILWLMHHGTGDKKYAELALQIETLFDKSLDGYVGLHHDVGFMWNLSAVNSYRQTGSERSRVRGLHAASLLAGRYNPRGRYIRSWNKGNFDGVYYDFNGWIIADCMMNLPLLYWASDELNDPSFRYIAIEHANTAMRTLVREDGSCNHIAVLDPESGDLIETFRGQGYDVGSSWTRGQAWGLYGFLLSYRHTKDKKYLDTAKRIAHYFIASIAATDYISRIDFRAPAEPVKIDTSATCIAVCGLLHLADETEGHDGDFYKQSAMQMLKAIEEQYCNWDAEYDSIVQMGSAQYHNKLEEFHVPLIYADYFFIEAIHKLLNPNFICW